MRLSSMRMSGFGQKTNAIVGVCIAAAAVFSFIQPAQAGDIVSAFVGTATFTLIAGPLNLLLVILYSIVSLLFSLNMLLTNLMISFAAFNNFVGAQPVVLGWPLVRDLVNMFFIVVLLLLAFSTIIHYEPFHYKNHLPKLLLMAVLINFSKTLVGVLIDFSQVITLTFVNGFKNAAFGNFMKMFQFGSILTVNQEMLDKVNSGELSGATQTIMNVFVALLFAIAILTIVSTVLTIMTIYFVVRIVLLWVLIILSPIAFFALALPPKLQTALGALSGEWWKKLGSLMTGGPIVAFFLWLSLATIQGAANPFPGMYTSKNLNEEASITNIGKPENITTFIVAIMMLLTGLKIAVDVSKEAAPKLGEVAQKIKASGGPAVLAARGAARAGRATARAADRRYDITGKMGRGLMAAGQAETARGGVRGAILGAAFTRAGARTERVGAERRAEFAAKQEKATKHLAPADQIKYFQAQRELALQTGNKEGARVLDVKIAQAMTKPTAIGARAKELEEGYLQRLPANQRNTDEAKAAAKAYGAGYAKREAGLALATAGKTAKEFGDTEALGKINEQTDKDPSMHQDPSDVAGAFSGMAGDMRMGLRNMKPDAFKDSMSVLAMAKAANWIGEDARLKEGYQDTDDYKEVAKNPARKKYVDAMLHTLETEEGRDRALVQLKGMSGAAKDEEKAQANAARQSMMVSPDGTAMMFANVAPGGGGAVSMVSIRDIGGGRVDINNFDQLIRGLTPALQASLRASLSPPGGGGLTPAVLNDFARGFRNVPMTSQQAQHIMANPAFYANPPAGGAATPAQVQFAVRGQSMGIPTPRPMEERVLNVALNDVSSTQMDVRMMNASAIANTDTEGLDRNEDLQRVVGDALDGKVDQLEKAFKASRNNPEVMKKMEGMVQNITSATEKVAGEATKRALTPVEQKLAKVGEDIKNNKVLQKVASRKGSKA